MTARVYLFVPGNSPRKMTKAAEGTADAIILDLEDSVAPSDKEDALRQVCSFLRHAGPRSKDRYWVRINATDHDRAIREVATLPLGSLCGLIIPKLSTIASIAPLAHGLDALEVRDGVEAGTIGFIGIVTETAASLLAGSDLGRGHPRLRGYTWGIEDLSADIGRAQRQVAAEAKRRLSEHAQTFCLLAATAAGIDAIDAVDTDIHNASWLLDQSRLAAELGFRGKMAIHPAQVAPIQSAFTPDAETLRWAAQIVEIAEAGGGRSVFQLDGQMIDQPHIAAARRILARSDTRQTTK